MFWPLLILHHTTDAVLFDWSDPSRATIDPRLPAPVPSRSTCTTGCRGGRWWGRWSSYDDWPCRMCNSADPALLNILVVHLYIKPYIGKTMNFSNYLRTCRSEIRGWYGWELTCRSPMEGRPGSGLWDRVAHIWTHPRFALLIHHFGMKLARATSERTVKNLEYQRRERAGKMLAIYCTRLLDR